MTTPTRTDLDRADEIDKLVSQAAALVFLMGDAKTELSDLNHHHMANAAWLGDELLERIRALALAGVGHE